jgi:methyltransferase
MVTQVLFVIFVLLLAMQRVFELRLSRRNEARLKEANAVEHAPGHFRWMKLMHIAWFPAMLLEVIALQRPFIPSLAIFAIFFFLAGQTLRLLAIRTLGPRWTVNIVTLPEAPPVERGIYRYIRHPNYLGVVLEILAVPLVHTAYLSAIIFTVLNALVLTVRIRAEEKALHQSDQEPAGLVKRPRFIPFQVLFSKPSKKQP